MRVSNEEKQKSRARILAAASRRFREQGIEGTGLADIMKDAGMTHGGFYKHFPDKDALVRDALAEAFVSLTPTGEAPSAMEPASFRSLYLSREHRDAPGQGCPIAALGGEVARADLETRRVMTEGVEARIALLRDGQGGLTREDAMRQLAQMIGALVVARAVEGRLSDEIIAAVRDWEPEQEGTGKRPQA